METPLTSKRAEQIRALFQEVVDLGPEERASHLDQRCRGDDALRREIDALLATSDTHYASICEDLDQLFLAPGDEADSFAEALIGQRVSHYQIQERLGAGGMGVVYKAEDTHLGRTVALKFLPPDLTRDIEARDRFVHEARAASALDHVNIGTIYEMGETSAGRTFIAMAYYAGETLKAKIERGPLPLDEAMDYAMQVAEGLKKAHRAGIIHRDIKPANVLVTADGVVKIVDFGLAKVRDVSLTQTGRTLGTVAYMSPEQACAEAVDHRSDIWSLGAVLYEMISGRLPFVGDYEQAVVYSILNEEPEPLTELRTGVPLVLEGVVVKCLAKEAKDRYQHVEEIPVDLRVLERQPGTTSGRQALNSGPSSARPVGRHGARWSLAGLITLFIVFALWGLWSTPSSPEQQPMRFAMRLPEGNALRGLGSPIALSRDGSRMVYVAGRGDTIQLFLRALDQFEVHRISGTVGAKSPFFSPDGQWVGFFADGALKKVSLSGGAPQFICDAPASLDLPSVSGSWGSDDTIIFSQYSASKASSSLWRVAAAGGTPERLSMPQEHADIESHLWESHLWPEILPGNKSILYTIWNFTGSARIAALSLETGEQQILIEQGSHARYVTTGHLLYAQAGDLLAVPFDVDQRKVTGMALPVVEGVMSNMDGDANFSVSENGSLVYVPEGVNKIERTLAWVDHNGAIEPLPIPTTDHVYTPRLSPDGNRVIFQQRPQAHLWLYDLTRGTLGRLTDENRSEWWYLWTNDGSGVVFNSIMPGDEVVNLYWKPTDGSVPEERLTQGDFHQSPQSLSSEGNVLAFLEAKPDSTTGFDIWTLPFEGDRTPRPFLQTSANEFHPAFSPDGRWLAYVSDQSGQWEVYVRPYPGTGGVTQISSNGGSEPLWSPDGRRLYYRGLGFNQYADRMMAVEIQTKPLLRNEPAFQMSKPRQLFEGPFFQCSEWGRSYDLTPEGDRFLMILDRRPEAAPTQLNVVVNWFEELKRRVPTIQ